MQRRKLFQHNHDMPQDEDELEYLRAMLARAHEKPRLGVRTIFRRIARGFFTTPKKVMLERIQKDSSPTGKAA